MRKLLLSAFLLGAAQQEMTAQGVYAERAHITVISGTSPLRAAWAGGYNVPQVAMADLNNDNRLDMVVFERYRETKTFINIATSGPAQYQYNPAYARHIPPIVEYLYMLDYNCDGIEDIFHYGGNGVTTGGVGFEIQKGYYQNDTLKFQFYRQLYYPMFGGNINAYSSPYDVPGIADVDGDGDIDFISYTLSGSRVDFYQNIRVEDGLHCDSVRIKLKSNCWGRVSQGAWRAHNLGIGGAMAFCNDYLRRPDDVMDPASSLHANAKTTIHANNTICLLDMDGDGDMDYLNGNTTFADIQYLKNGRVEYGWHRDTIVTQDTTWQSGGTMLNLPFFPHAQHIDADGDGKRDLLITPHGDGNSKNYDNFYLYKNVGTNTVPQFQFQQQDFLQNISLDAGSNSYPAFYDYNRDGKKDLFIGSTGRYQTGGTYRGQLFHLQNSSTVGNAAMTLQSSDAFGLTAHNLPGAAPAFGDIDGDGLDDLILGHSNGRLSFIKNTAANAAVQPVWSGAPTPLRDINGDTVDVGDAAVPVAYDLNKDGRMDLVIGNQTGHLYYYRKNPGTGMKLQLDSTQLGGVKADPNAFIGFAAPFFGPIDNTGIPYLLVGSSSGRIHRFDGFQSGNTTVNFPMIDTIYSGLKLSGRSSVAVADVDGDGWYDMVLGNVLGGVKLYKQVQLATVDVVHVAAAGGFELFPNPASAVVHLRRTENASIASVRVYNTTGQLLITEQIPAGQSSISIDFSLVATGVYLVAVDGGSGLEVRRLSVIR